MLFKWVTCLLSHVFILRSEGVNEIAIFSLACLLKKKLNTETKSLLLSLTLATCENGPVVQHLFFFWTTAVVRSEESYYVDNFWIYIIFKQPSWYGTLFLVAAYFHHTLSAWSFEDGEPKWLKTGSWWLSRPWLGRQSCHVNCNTPL